MFSSSMIVLYICRDTYTECLLCHICDKNEAMVDIVECISFTQQ